MKTSFDRYDDSDVDSESELEADFEYPKLLVDEEGRKKFILNKTEEQKFYSRLSGIRIDAVAILDVDTRRRTIEVKSEKTTAKKKGKTHGIAPFGRTVPLPGNAYVTGKGGKGKITLKESSSETFNRIQEVKIGRMAKDNKRYIQRLKKTGKVCTLVPFMLDT